MNLREMVLRGEFGPGERISEIPLSRRLGVSRTPIRLALERLAQEGLLEPTGTGGFRVREFTVRDIWDAIEARGVLEGAAARLAAERLTDFRELDPLRRIDNELEKLSRNSIVHGHPPSSDEMIRYADLNGAFHAALIDLAKSPMLRWALERIQSIPFASPTTVVPSRSVDGTLIAQAQHAALLDAIGNREGARAENLAKEHARFARQSLEKALAHPPESLAGREMGLALIKRELPDLSSLPGGRRLAPVARVSRQFPELTQPADRPASHDTKGEAE
jgi:GntR family transcriptional regulator of vanillate catabolism